MSVPLGRVAQKKLKHGQDFSWPGWDGFGSPWPAQSPWLKKVEQSPSFCRSLIRFSGSCLFLYIYLHIQIYFYIYQYHGHFDNVTS